MLPRGVRCSFHVTLLLVLGACSTSDMALWGDAPDITGRYNVILEGTAGCEGEQDLLDIWAPGALTVQGDEPGSLSFDFGGDIVLVGSIADTYTYQFGGYVEVEGWGLGTGSTGVAYAEGGGYVLEGSLSADADDGGIKTCTISGPYVATQVAR